jgi:hypothetical protein
VDVRCRERTWNGSASGRPQYGHSVIGALAASGVALLACGAADSAGLIVAPMCAVFAVMASSVRDSPGPGEWPDGQYVK